MIKKKKTVKFSSKEEDILLVNKVKTGDESAFAHIVKKYRPHLYFKLYGCVNFDKEYAEDILQDIFVKVFLNIKKYDDGKYTFSSWITKIAKNQLLDQIIKDKNKPSYRNSLRFSQTMDEYDPEYSKIITVEHLLSHSTISKFDEDLDLANKKDAISIMSKKLNHLEREVITLFYIEEMKYKEIMQTLGIDMNKVKTSLHRAKEKIKREIENHKKK